jgi:hypothetical protein
MSDNSSSPYIYDIKGGGFFDSYFAKEKVFDIPLTGLISYRNAAAIVCACVVYYFYNHLSLKEGYQSMTFGQRLTSSPSGANNLSLVASDNDQILVGSGLNPRGTERFLNERGDPTTVPPRLQRSNDKALALALQYSKKKQEELRRSTDQSAAANPHDKRPVGNLTYEDYLAKYGGEYGGLYAPDTGTDDFTNDFRLSQMSR